MYFPLQLTRTPNLKMDLRDAVLVIDGELYTRREQDHASQPVGLFRGKTKVQISEKQSSGWARVKVNHQESWVDLKAPQVKSLDFN